MFELSFFTAGPGTQPLVVVLYYAAFAPGVRASQSIDAMAVIYMGLMLMLLIAALSFVNPTNLVARLREDP
jgi:putative spermidine/putrescine transport system permease protein